jgi:hypothetical protein
MTLQQPTTFVNGTITLPNYELRSQDDRVISLAFELAELTCSPDFVPTDEDWDLAEALAAWR